MKSIPHLIALAGLCIGISFPARQVQAQNAKPPTQLTYQGFLTDANGTPFGNSTPVNKTIIFRIYNSLTGGTLVWSSQQVVTVDKGYFSALLGQGSAGPEGDSLFKSDLTDIFSGAGVSERYLELTADGATISPRLRFHAAPYAMTAKSATEVIDPISGAKSLAISGGVLQGNGGGLTNLQGGSISGGVIAESRLPNLTASGKVANSATTATSANTASAIVARDASGNFSAGTITASGFSGSGADLTGLNASQIGKGTLDNARTTATSANTANAIVARDGSGNFSAGAVTATSFKINATPTLVLTSISRGSLYSSAPVSGVTQTNPNNQTNNGRQSANENPNWWKSSSTSLGTMLYTATFSVPNDETWEVAYTCQYYWNTDDSSGLVMSVDDAATDDANLGGYKISGGVYLFNQTLIMTSGTHTVRVKGIIGSGSGTDYIQFPWHTPAHMVVKKYKTY